MVYLGAVTSGVVFVALFFGAAAILSYIFRFIKRD
jgi:hypothetical protein